MSIISYVLEIFSKLLPGIITSIADKVLLKKKVIDILKKYDRSVDTAADIRQIEKSEDEELSQKWEERWGTKPVVEKSPSEISDVNEVTIKSPNEVYVDEEFSIFLSRNCKGCDLFVDAWRLCTLDDKLEQPVSLNGAGKRRIRILCKNKEIGFSYVEVKKNA